MDYLKEIFRLQAENKKHEELVEKNAKALGAVLEAIMPDNEELQTDAYGFIEACVEDFCDESYAMGYNDCLIEFAKSEAIKQPVIYPNQ